MASCPCADTSPRLCAAAQLTCTSCLYVNATSVKGEARELWNMLLLKIPRSHNFVVWRVLWTTVLTELFPLSLPCPATEPCYPRGERPRVHRSGAAPSVVRARPSSTCSALELLSHLLCCTEPLTPSSARPEGTRVHCNILDAQNRHQRSQMTEPATLRHPHHPRISRPPSGIETAWDSVPLLGVT